MFTSIRIRNLRVITDLEVNNIGQVNLFVGDNSCGKTTMLEGLFFLIGATNPMLPLNANTFRGLSIIGSNLWDTYFHNADPTIAIEICGQLRRCTEEQCLVIRPHYSKQTAPQSVPSDSVSPRLAPGASQTTQDIDGLELTYLGSENHSREVTSRVFLRKDEIISEGTRDRAIRGVFVGPLTIHDWKQRFAEVQRKKQLREVISLLNEIEPTISDLRLNDVGFLEADIGLPRLMPANLMGGGIAKLLSIALSMLEFQNGVVLIDEIENGLGHAAQQRMWEAILNWAQSLNVQVFATTHSIECVRAFNNAADTTLFGSEARLFRIERKDENFRAVEYSKDDLAQSLESNWEVR